MDDHVVLFEQTLATNHEVLSENQKLREELKKTSRSLEYYAAAVARQGQLKKAQTADEISAKECPSTIILSGKYY